MHCRFMLPLRGNYMETTGVWTLFSMMVYNLILESTGLISSLFLFNCWSKQAVIKYISLFTVG